MLESTAATIHRDTSPRVLSCNICLELTATNSSNHQPSVDF